MNINNEVLILIVIQLVSIGVWVGGVSSFKKHIEEKMKDFKEKLKENRDEFNANLKRLEEKQDKHNNLIERMVQVEQSTKSAHHRLDEIVKNK